jgi:hypothetical protein
VKYFHPMHFDTVNGRYVLELPTVVPKVRPGGGACSMTATFLPSRTQSWGLCAYHLCAWLKKGQEVPDTPCPGAHVGSGVRKKAQAPVPLALRVQLQRFQLPATYIGVSQLLG